MNLILCGGHLCNPRSHHPIECRIDVTGCDGLDNINSNPFYGYRNSFKPYSVETACAQIRMTTLFVVLAPDVVLNRTNKL